MGRRYKEALEKSKSLIKTKSNSREELSSLLQRLTFPTNQPVDLDTAVGLSDLAVSALETLSDRQTQVSHQDCC